MLITCNIRVSQSVIFFAALSVLFELVITSTSLLANAASKALVCLSVYSKTLKIYSWRFGQPLRHCLACLTILFESQVHHLSFERCEDSKTVNGTWTAKNSGFFFGEKST